MPRLWNETIEEHRREVRDAILDTTAALVAEHGLASVTMSQIAAQTGIGRATLYKYFSDVEAMLVAWHERQITGHLEHLAEVRDQTGNASQRLEAVLEAYALISHQHHGTELAALLHRGKHVARAQQHLRDFIRDLLTEGAATGDIRDDVAPDELASYCLHALTAASRLPSKAAVRRLGRSHWLACARARQHLGDPQPGTTAAGSPVSTGSARRSADRPRGRPPGTSWLPGWLPPFGAAGWAA